MKSNSSFIKKYGTRESSKYESYSRCQVAAKRAKKQSVSGLIPKS